VPTPAVQPDLKQWADRLYAKEPDAGKCGRSGFGGLSMKLSRRSFCACALGAPLMARPAFAQGAACEVMTPERQARTMPDEAISRLAEGNRRFVEGRTVNCDLAAQARRTATYQAPFAAIVGCIDSRVPPELIFDQRIGDVFCARVAGNFVNTDILGSLEYATAVAGAKAVVVLGHTSCGAIESAIKGVEMGHITGLLANIAPAVAAAQAGAADHPAGADRAAGVTVANVGLTVEAVTARSAVMRALVAAGKLKVAGAVHDVATGRVAWL